MGVRKAIRNAIDFLQNIQRDVDLVLAGANVKLVIEDKSLDYSRDSVTCRYPNLTSILRTKGNHDVNLHELFDQIHLRVWLSRTECEKLAMHLVYNGYIREWLPDDLYGIGSDNDILISATGRMVNGKWRMAFMKSSPLFSYEPDGLYVEGYGKIPYDEEYIEHVRW